jgi:hypothetical protein
MDATKWNETLPCPKCGSDDTDIGWTSGDSIKVTKKIHNEISPGILHDKATVSTVLRRPLRCLIAVQPMKKPGYAKVWSWMKMRRRLVDNIKGAWKTAN